MEIKVPSLPESVSDATLVSWHKKAGDSVSRDENLVDLETDKIVLEVPSPASGTLKEIKMEDGATVKAGDLIAILDEGEGKGQKKEDGKKAATDGGERKEAAAAREKAPREEKEEPAEEKKAAPERERAAEPEEEPEAEAADEEDREERAESAHKLSPSVRRLLEEHDLEAAAVSGTGKDGRLTKSDVMDYLKRHDETADRGEAEPGALYERPEPREGEPTRNDRRVPMTRLRARIAERLVEAQHTAAMLTTFNEIDLSRVIDLRKRYKEPFEKEHGVRLGFMSFFAKASVEALKKFPAVNASVEGKEIVYHDYFDIGIAVSSDRGLMVPVVRNVDRLSFAEIEKAVDSLGKKVREGSIGMDDLTGGTFTVTNGGIFGSLLSTPILNPPQSAILGMHAIQDRPMAAAGEVVVRPMMYVALTYDHRIVDGREAVQFLVSVKQSLEDPGRLLLQF